MEDNPQTSNIDTTQTQKEEKEKSYAKRDFLVQIEQEVGREWEETKIFEVDAPKEGEPRPPKFMATFPYPYMNGRLHLGHSFTISKAEFAAGYYRLKGRKSLFPFGFHCTGMPIKACADKIKREIEAYGCPPQFPVEEEKVETVQEQQQPQEPAGTVETVDPTAFHSAKAKVQAKGSKEKYQWQIMKEMGVPEEEIPKFADALYWLKYFPPHTMTDLKAFGCCVDWRRSFITTDVNPYYDSFVRWQFETLYSQKKISFGKRFSIYSPLDGQPCADHDRSKGEGVLPQEYTLVKQEVILPFPEKMKALEGKKVYLVPATLRPETMYGQTNCFVLPTGRYGAYEYTDTEVFIMGAHAARNLAFQGLDPEKFGKVKLLLELTGQDLIGLPLKAPLAKYDVIYTLPMLNISMEKGTGVVTSVPSDAPDDYAALMDLKNKPAFREKYGVKDHMVLPYEIVPIIHIPGYGNVAAEVVVRELKIQSQNDKIQLAQAKDIVYTKGFYEGTMLLGDFKGMKVSEAKVLTKDLLLHTGQAIRYSEPAEVVISRSGDKCVSALTDQWYLNYGEETWKAQALDVLKNMETYGPETRHQFESTFEWLNQWACSRSYGLGSRLPWDPQYLIESLSDSTIYMAYYTVAHYLQGDVDGSKAGSANIRPEQLTNQVWDYIFRGGELPQTDIPEQTLKTLRNEFLYWYPLDLRVSGKDLIPNHLTFFLYNHVAMFPKELCPRAVRANGHLLLDSRKMSKSEGNFLTLADGLQQYSADGIRFALADAGDSMDDANFVSNTANHAVLRLYSQYEWIKETLESIDSLRDGEPHTFFDLVFQNEIDLAIKLTDENYEHMKFRDALRTGFFDLQTARDNYRVGEKSMNKKLILDFIRVQTILLSPICPHFCEFVWKKLLGNSTSIRNTPWPTPISGEIDHLLLHKNQFLQECLHKFRLNAESMRPQYVDVETGYVYVSNTYPHWHRVAIEALQQVYDKEANKFPEDYKQKLANIFKGNNEIKKDMNKIMSLVAVMPERIKTEGEKALSLAIAFDEAEVLGRDGRQLLMDSLGLKTVHIYLASDESAPDVEGKKSHAVPGKPIFTFGGEKRAGAGKQAKPAKAKAAGGAGKPKPKGKAQAQAKGGEKAAQAKEKGKGKEKADAKKGGDSKD
jgi:leucyl-tRNA synthetase